MKKIGTILKFELGNYLLINYICLFDYLFISS